MSLSCAGGVATHASQAASNALDALTTVRAMAAISSFAASRPGSDSAAASLAAPRPSVPSCEGGGQADIDTGGRKGHDQHVARLVGDIGRAAGDHRGGQRR